MKQLLIVLLVFFTISCKTTQTSTPTISEQYPTIDTASVLEPELPEEPMELLVDPGPYRAEDTKHHDLIHTKLEVRFDWERQYLMGVATLELQPYFYPQDHLVLDAKGFELHKVELVEGNRRTPLSYDYDQSYIAISLDRMYSKGEHYFVSIDYTAKPNELQAGGSAAITSDQGLYFINPLGKEPNKPQQIWTQGETEASSCWFPTLDSPNQRTTQEIFITVKEKFETLSNGDLIYARNNGDGTRTDYWKMDQPHAPYLFMMAIGEFAVVKEDWNGKEVSYYVEPEYQQYAADIFGDTPEMLSFFSEMLDYPYPWSKYAQVVVRDYVSGAMENTTASVFMEALQVDDRYLIDDDWDGIIAHELLHQWFGDLVTCESWSNLTLNEAFATYAEYLWAEHEHGKDEADYLGYEEQLSYLAEAKEKQVDLIRFYYDDKEDMFDSHSYAKGGRILHMLRNLVGDKAFFSALNQYLKTNAGKPVEVHHLRLAFEEVTGQDLNWFFNQWFLGSGHPVLQITKEHVEGMLRLSVSQQQDLSTTPLYRLPLTIQVWDNGQKQEHTIEITQQSQDFNIPCETTPDFVVFDSKSQLLGEVSYERPNAELMNQYLLGESALVRINALEGLLADSVADRSIVELLIQTLDDKFWGIRQLGTNLFEGYSGDQLDEVTKALKRLATEDPKSAVRADAITTLSSFPSGNEYHEVYREAMQERSYLVAGAGLTAYLQTEAEDKPQVLSQYENQKNINLVLPLADYYALEVVADKYQWFVKQLDQGQGELMYYLVNYFGQYLTNQITEQQLEGARRLEELGTSHPTYYVRFSAYQALSLLEEVPGVLEMKERVKLQETDPRLIEVYQQMP